MTKKKLENKEDIKKSDVISETEKMMSSIESSMKKDMQDRKKILKDMEKSLVSHSEKLVKYTETEKAYKLLEVKYANLLNEYMDFEKNKNLQVSKLENNINNLELENKLLKKLITENKKKISGLQSIVELMVNDYGISNIEVVTGLPIDKIKEYFQN